MTLTEQLGSNSMDDDLARERRYRSHSNNGYVKV